MLSQENRPTSREENRRVSPIAHLSAQGELANSALLGCGIAEKVFVLFAANWPNHRHVKDYPQIDFDFKSCTFSVEVARPRIGGDEISIKIAFPVRFILNSSIVPLDISRREINCYPGEHALDSRELAVVRALAVTAK
jgi:hypothetical protein